MNRALVCLLAAACGSPLGACGGDDGETAGRTAATATTAAVAPPPQRIDVRAPGSLPAAERARFAAGRDVAMRAGCLACHRIGTAGSDRIGSDLNGIGDRLTPPAIRYALTDPPAPMPAYEELSSEQFDALVTFLSALGAASCPGDSDCG